MIGVVRSLDVEDGRRGREEDEVRADGKERKVETGLISASIPR